MSRRLIFIMILALILAGMFDLVFRVQRVEASGTIYIRADGNVEGTTRISTVDNIIYTFTGDINDSIVVERDNIVVDGAGYTLQGTGNYTGISLFERSNVTIKNAKITSFRHGIMLNMSSSNTIYGNTVAANNWHGIWIHESSNNTVV
jgi:parallel beta-helix repeat protein